MALRPLPLSPPQVCVALTMNPPQPGEPSYELYAQERDGILEVRRFVATN